LIQWAERIWLIPNQKKIVHRTCERQSYACLIALMKAFALDKISCAESCSKKSVIGLKVAAQRARLQRIARSLDEEQNVKSDGC
jgi:hypothetical protein